MKAVLIVISLIVLWLLEHVLIAFLIGIALLYIYRLSILIFVLRSKIRYPKFSYVFDSVVGQKDPNVPGYLQSNREMFKKMETLVIGNTLNDAPHLERRVITLPGTEAKIVLWTPKEASGKLGVVFHYPGGGFVKLVPHPEGNSSIIPVLFKDEHNWIVADVVYRLVPESSIQVSMEDSYMAFKYIMERADEFNIDLDKVVVFGESAGALHSADIAIRAKKDNYNLTHLFLIVPPTQDPNPESASVIKNGFGYGLYWEQMVFYNETVQKSSDGTRELAPMLEKEIELFPETTILSALYDPLLEDAELLHEALQKLNVKSTYHQSSGSHISFIVDPQSLITVLKQVLHQVHTQ